MRFLAYSGLLFNICLFGMEFKDADGLMCQIPSHLVTIFHESTAGEDLKEDLDADRLVDFSEVKRACLKGEYINAVLGYAHNLESLTKKEVDPKETYYLDTANYLGIQQKEVLYHLANRVWGYLRTGRQKEDLQLSDADEAYVRKVARPYLHSPAKLLESQLIACKFFGLHPEPHRSYYINLSFNTHNPTQPYPLACLDGLQEFISRVTREIRSNKPNWAYLDLSGNALDEFVIDQLLQAPDLKVGSQPFRSICLANNAICRIAWKKPTTVILAGPTIGDSQKIDLSGNPIKVIDDSVYELVHLYRTQGKRLELTIPDHRLSLNEVALAKQQWFLAANTLVDRYFKTYNPDGIGIVAGILTVLMGGVADVAMGTNGTALLGGIGTGVGTWFVLNHKYLPPLAHKLATKTHPEIKNPKFSCERPFGNTWLRDYEKPQLILGKRKSDQ